jgi:hypothetical protein
MLPRLEAAATLPAYPSLPPPLTAAVAPVAGTGLRAWTQAVVQAQLAASVAPPAAAVGRTLLAVAAAVMLGYQTSPALSEMSPSVALVEVQAE